MDENPKSGVKGIIWSKVSKKWQVTYCINGRRYHIGLYANLEDAKLALRKEKEFA